MQSRLGRTAGQLGFREVLVQNIDIKLADLLFSPSNAEFEWQVAGTINVADSLVDECRERMLRSLLSIVRVDRFVLPLMLRKFEFTATSRGIPTALAKRTSTCGL
jgi:hypothetical protein